MVNECCKETLEVGSPESQQDIRVVPCTYAVQMPITQKSRYWWGHSSCYAAQHRHENLQIETEREVVLNKFIRCWNGQQGPEQLSHQKRTQWGAYLVWRLSETCMLSNLDLTWRSKGWGGSIPPAFLTCPMNGIYVCRCCFQFIILHVPSSDLSDARGWGPFRLW